MPWAPELPFLTERLELREHLPTDVDDMLEFHSDPDVVRYVPWPVSTREQVLESLEKRLHAGRVEKPGEWLILAIVQRASDKVIGEVLLKCTSVDEGELGYALHRGYQGQGIAFEAAEAMLRLGIERFGLRRVTAELDSRNTASARLLERLGFTLHRSFAEEFKGEQTTALEYELLIPLGG
jgi:RimJ/RimL family protein N-acetyltransferase